MNPPRSGFQGLGISPSVLTLLEKLGFTTPTPIQEQSIPQAIEGKDVIGVAQTGTGKTLAFGIPLIQALLKNPRARALVLLPTRDLALQVEESLRKIGTPLGLKSVIIVGGDSMNRQVRELSRRPQIFIATPGRMIDHLQQKTINLSEVRIVVLDEADRMLDMGFAPQLKRILPLLPTERQTMLFSATMPESIIGMARAYMKLPVRVEVARPGTAAKDVTQELFIVAQPEKPRLLEKVLQEYRGSVLVFARTKFSAKRIAAHCRALGHASVEFHSNRSLSQRKEALDGFKNGRYRVLVATDIAARGIDVKNIELVINYDLPTVAEDYVHRIGRTGRAGGSGHAISFARPDERRDVQAIERLMRSTLSVSRLPELPPMRPGVVAAPLDRPDRPMQRGGGYRGGGRSSGGSRGPSSFQRGGHGPSRGGSGGPSRGPRPERRGRY
jgi:ATP-dependent RNA helicase RhlE